MAHARTHTHWHISMNDAFICNVNHCIRLHAHLRINTEIPTTHRKKKQSQKKYTHRKQNTPEKNTIEKNSIFEIWQLSNAVQSRAKVIRWFLLCVLTCGAHSCDHNWLTNGLSVRPSRSTVAQLTGHRVSTFLCTERLCSK